MQRLESAVGYKTLATVTEVTSVSPSLPRLTTGIVLSDDLAPGRIAHLVERWTAGRKVPDSILASTIKGAQLQSM